MSDDAIAMEKAREWALDRIKSGSGKLFFHWTETQRDMREAYLAGYAQATRDAKEAVAATIRAEVPERRQGSRSIE